MRLFRETFPSSASLFSFASPKRLSTRNFFLKLKSDWQYSGLNSTQSSMKTRIFLEQFLRSLHPGCLFFHILSTSHKTSLHIFSLFVAVIVCVRLEEYFVLCIFITALWVKEFLPCAYENSIYKLFVLHSIGIAVNDNKVLARFTHLGIYFFKSESCFSFSNFFMFRLIASTVMKNFFWILKRDIWALLILSQWCRSLRYFRHE